MINNNYFNLAATAATAATTTLLLNMPRIGLGTLGLVPSETSPVIVSVCVSLFMFGIILVAI
jgi:hypothetical protein